MHMHTWILNILTFQKVFELWELTSHENSRKWDNLKKKQGHYTQNFAKQPNIFLFPKLFFTPKNTSSKVLPVHTRHWPSAGTEPRPRLCCPPASPGAGWPGTGWGNTSRQDWNSDKTKFLYNFDVFDNKYQERMIGLVPV